MSDPQDSQLDRAKEKKAMAWLLVPCALLATAGFVLGIDGAPAVTAVTLGDVSDASVVEIRDDQGMTVLSGEFRSRTDSLGNTEKDAALMDGQGRRVIGEVEVEIPAKGRSDRRPELEVDIIELKPNATFTVVIDDTPVGRFTTDDRGSIDVELQEGELPPPPPQSGGV